MSETSSMILPRWGVSLETWRPGCQCQIHSPGNQIFLYLCFSFGIILVKFYSKVGLLVGDKQPHRNSQPILFRAYLASLIALAIFTKGGGQIPRNITGCSIVHQLNHWVIMFFQNILNAPLDIVSWNLYRVFPHEFILDPKQFRNLMISSKVIAI